MISLSTDRADALNTDAAPLRPPVSFENSQRRDNGLPEKPLIVIESGSSWVSLQLFDIWAHRELLYFLVWRDLKVRYKQTVFGIAWVVLQPLLMTLIFTIVLGKLVRVSSNNIPYPLFAYAGLMLWIFFSGAISVTGNCLVGNANLITKVYFPRLIIPLATMIARLVDLGVVFIILCGLMIYYRVPLTSHLIALPVFVLLISLFALGFGLWTSAVNVRYRDVGLALPVLIQLWMFVSPVVYGLDQVPQKLVLAYSLNPLVGMIEGFRAALFGTGFYWPAIIISTAVTVFLLIYGSYVFQRREKTFADII
jgi:lipopolysaccharide transport system permease protein